MKRNGGIVLIDPETATVLRIIAFEINPDTMTRSFQVRGVSGEGGDRIEALRLKGPPVETLKMDVVIDAMIGAGNPTITEVGLHPQLAALELLCYPRSGDLLVEKSKADAGMLEIAPAIGPLPLLIWGPKRIVPVRVTELSVTEEEFDEKLNPVRAKVSLGLRVLTVDDLGFGNKGGELFMTHLTAREQLAARAPAGTFDALGIDGIP
jgi:hypothetical protein